METEMQTTPNNEANEAANTKGLTGLGFVKKIALAVLVLGIAYIGIAWASKQLQPDGFGIISNLEAPSPTEAYKNIVLQLNRAVKHGNTDIRVYFSKGYLPFEKKAPGYLFLLASHFSKGGTIEDVAVTDVVYFKPDSCKVSVKLSYQKHIPDTFEQYLVRDELHWKIASVAQAAYTQSGTNKMVEKKGLQPGF